jgi:hypothetical protein
MDAALFCYVYYSMCYQLQIIIGATCIMQQSISYQVGLSSKNKVLEQLIKQSNFVVLHLDIEFLLN